MNEIKFKTLEDLEKQHPIGRTIWKKSRRRAENKAYANKIDLAILRKHYGTENVEVLDGSWAKCWFTETKEKKVEGYLFDGEYWYPAYNTWDGWIPYDEDDLFD